MADSTHCCLWGVFLIGSKHQASTVPGTKASFLTGYDVDLNQQKGSGSPAVPVLVLIKQLRFVEPEAGYKQRWLMTMRHLTPTVLMLPKIA